MTPESWNIIRDLGGWGVVVLVLILGGRALARFFERALVGFETALVHNQDALRTLGQAVERFAAFEAEERETHLKLIQTQESILEGLRSLREEVRGNHRNQNTA